MKKQIFPLGSNSTLLHLLFMWLCVAKVNKIALSTMTFLNIWCVGGVMIRNIFFKYDSRRNSRSSTPLDDMKLDKTACLPRSINLFSAAMDILERGPAKVPNRTKLVNWPVLPYSKWKLWVIYHLKTLIKSVIVLTTEGMTHLCRAFVGLHPNPHPTLQNLKQNSSLARGHPWKCLSPVHGYIFNRLPPSDTHTCTHRCRSFWALMPTLWLHSSRRREVAASYQVLSGSLLHLLHMCKHLHISGRAPFFLATLNPFTSCMPRI